MIIECWGAEKPKTLLKFEAIERKNNKRNTLSVYVKVQLGL